ncbi:Hypothetical protein NTJ_02768 [Nesidiocoris tenuis]|uniref:Uncharacterized protein n=1 Tax=Nesidiocoris tenuis TaxID=355587 RepID=A0ABN7ACD9_9HEMI|nr:Hypothetical protein NTJ_02768 [Nesidiocoris tenuis]
MSPRESQGFSDQNRLDAQTLQKKGSVVSKVVGYPAKMYDRYQLVLGLNLYEPWEKILLNTFVLGAAVLLVHSAYTYLPNYISSTAEKIFLYFKD